MNKIDRTPQDKFFNRSKKYSWLVMGLYVITYALSLMQRVFLNIEPKIFFVSSSIMLILIVGFGIIKDTNFDIASNLSRRFLMDNSFGTKKEPHENKEFYDSKGIEYGIAKMLANVHESALFTSRISELMNNFYSVLSGALIIILLCSIFLNGLDDGNALFLNFVLSGGVLIRWYSIKGIYRKSYNIFKDANDICSIYEKNKRINEVTPEIIELLIRYENVLAVEKIVLSDSIYNRICSSLKEEWNKHRENYSIYDIEKEKLK